MRGPAPHDGPGAAGGGAREGLLAVGLALLAVGLLAAVGPGTTDLLRHELPLLVAAPAFAVARLVRIPVLGAHGDTRVAPLEVPVLLGVFFTTPATLVQAALVGTAAGSLLAGRRSPGAVALDTARSTAAAIAALLVHRVLTGGTHVVDSRGLFVALLAAVACRAVQVAVEQVHGVLVAHAPTVDARRAVHGVSTTAPLALVSLIVGYHVPAAAWILALPATVLALDLRSTARAQHERRHLEGELHRAVVLDRLTGVASRDALMDRLDSTPDDVEVHVLVVDIDDFGAVNEQFGTPGGDRLLRTVADRLGGVVEDGDLVARLAGDEFVVVTTGVSHDAAHRRAAALRSAVERPVPLHGRSIRVRASIGMVSSRTPDADRGALLEHAQAASREAKRRRRGSIVVWQPWMAAATSADVALRSDLVEALDADELEVHVQPFHELGGVVVGGEVLLRWTHPERGPVSPEVFVPMAEAAGLVDRIGRHVLPRACEELVRWQAMGAELVLSVNISAAELLDADFVRRVGETLQLTGAEPSLLMLEITERDLLMDVAGALGRLQALAALGVRLAIDDFGTGYSSLAYLQHFPVDVIKVARPFVQAIDDPDDRGVVARAVIDLAHALGMRVLAEAVETETQRERLEELGCDLAQGWLWSRAMPTRELHALLEDDGWEADAARRFDRRPDLRGVGRSSAA